MKQIIIPALPKYLVKVVPKAIQLAEEFLYPRYGASVFDTVIVKFMPESQNGRIYYNEKCSHPEFGHAPVVLIGVKRWRLWLYKKSTLGTYKQGVNVGPLAGIACTHWCMN